MVTKTQPWIRRRFMTLGTSICRGVMTVNGHFILILAIYFLTLFPLYAQSFMGPSQKIEPGLQIKAGFGLIGFQTKGQIGDRIDSYNESAEIEETLLPWPNFQLHYNDKNGHGNWYLEMRQGVVVGRNQQTGIGKFKLEAGLDLRGQLINNEFKNPYLLGENRDKTSKSQNRWALEYEYGKKVGFSAKFQREEWELADDETPKVDASLGRNGSRDVLSAGVKLWFLRLGYDSINTQTEGEADSSDGYIFTRSLAIPLFMKGLMAVISYGEGEIEYNATHPIFNETRIDNIENFHLMLMLNKGQTTYQAMIIMQETNSNIDFFDTNRVIASMGITWKLF